MNIGNFYHFGLSFYILVNSFLREKYLKSGMSKRYLKTRLKFSGVLRGFTFVEMLLATVMVSLIAVALYVMLANGIKVWEVVNQESSQIDINIFVERISEELKNSFDFKNIVFYGEKNILSFPAKLNVPERENGFMQGVGKVQYSYDSRTKTLSRQQFDYQQLCAGEKAEPQMLVKKLDSFLFKYYFYDEEKKDFFWTNIWPPPELKSNTILFPLAVRIEMSFKENNTVKTYQRTISIPAGGILPGKKAE